MKTPRNSLRFTLLLLIAGLISFNSFGQVESWKLKEPNASNINAGIYDQYSRSVLFFSNTVYVDYMPMTKRSKNKSLFSVRGLSYNSQNIDAAFNIDQDHAFLFQGDTYFEFEIRNRVVNNKGKWPLPQHWGKKIDAATLWAEDMVFMFRGSEYFIYTPSTGATSEPDFITSWDGWPANWKNIDAVTNPGDGFIYFFRNSDFLIWDLSNSVFLGKPKDIKTGQAVFNQSFAKAKGPSYSKPSFNNTNAAVETQATDGSDWCLVGYPSFSGDEESVLVEKKIAMFGNKKGAIFENQLMEGSRVAEVRVYGYGIIKGIQIILETTERQKLEQPVIGNAEGTYESFILDPDECIRGVNGKAFGASGQFIYSIQFQTNKKVSPTYGGKGRSKGQKAYQLQIPSESAFYGLTGRAKNYLSAIGMKYTIYESEPPQVVAQVSHKNEEHYESNQTEQFADASNSGETSNHKNRKFNQEEETAADEFSLHPSSQSPHEYRDDYKDFTQDLWNITWGSQSKTMKTLPAKDWLGAGVNLLTIDPLDIPNSPRSPKKPIVVSNSNHDADEFVLPWGTKYKTRNKSKTKESKTIIKNYSAFRNEFKGSVTIEVGVPKIAAGSLSASHRNVNTDEFGSEKVYWYKDVQASIYKVDMDLIWTDNDTKNKYRQKTDEEFRKAVKKLPLPEGSFSKKTIRKKGDRLPPSVEEIKGSYERLYKSYGTHIINSVLYGGRFISTYEINKSTASQMRLSESALRVQMSGTLKKVSLGADISLEQKSKSTQESESYDFTQETYVTGGRASTFDKWDERYSEYPDAMEIGLIGLYQLLNDAFFPEDKDIKKKHDILKMVIQEYIVNNMEENRGGDGKDFFKFAPRDVEYKVTINSLACEHADDGQGEASEYFGTIKAEFKGTTTGANSPLQISNNKNNTYNLNTGSSETFEESRTYTINEKQTDGTFIIKGDNFEEYDTSSGNEIVGSGNKTVRLSEIKEGEPYKGVVRIKGDGEKIAIHFTISKKIKN